MIITFLKAIGRLLETIAYIYAQLFSSQHIVDDATKDDPPVVFVHGFKNFSLYDFFNIKHFFTIRWFWKSKRKHFFPNLPGFCNEKIMAQYLYHYLKGGRPVLDNGAPGRHFEGVYKQWSAQHPVHFVCHSLGTRAVCTLETMLSTNTVPNVDIPKQDKGRMISSIMCSNATFKGQQTVIDYHKDNGFEKNLKTRYAIAFQAFLFRIVTRWPSLGSLFDPFTDAYPDFGTNWWSPMSVDEFNTLMWDSSLWKTISTSLQYSRNPNIAYLISYTDATVRLFGIDLILYPTSIYDLIMGNDDAYTDGLVNIDSQLHIWENAQGYVMTDSQFSKNGTTMPRGDITYVLTTGAHNSLSNGMWSTSIKPTLKIISGLSKTLCYLDIKI